MGFLSGLTDVFKSVGGALNPVMPLIGAGANILGGIIGSETDKDINRQQTELTKESWQWQERMANTAHQREVADLRAAGLNPILSARLGGSATPPISTPTLHAPGRILAEGASSASARFLEAQSVKQNIATSKAQQMAYSAQAVSTGEDARRKALFNDLYEQEQELEKWKVGERKKSRTWEMILDDARRGMGSIFPFSGASSRGNFGKGDSVGF